MHDTATAGSVRPSRVRVRRGALELLPAPLPALALAGTARRTRILARLLALFSLSILVGVFFVPWQQTVRGTGRVIAFNPLDRRADIEAPVEGRVRKVHVVENQRVAKGDLIASTCGSSTTPRSRGARRRSSASSTSASRSRARSSRSRRRSTPRSSG
jgi:adhesin transport system membrane fusion protein